MKRGTQRRIAHDLAVKLGIVSVDEMLKSISVHEWRDWQVYMAMAPFSEERADLRAAQICSALVNMWRDTKEHPRPIPLKDFLLKFGDSAEETAKKAKPQTLEEQERYIMDWIAGSNQVMLEEKRRGA